MKAERMAIDLSGLDQFKASSLLDDPVRQADGAPRRVALDLIDFDPKQPRRRLNQVALVEMAETIKEHGVLEPVSLRTNPDRPGRFILNRGERRVRASRLAKMPDVPAFIDERVDPYAQVVENDQREDLSLFDLATFVCEREAAGDSRAEIARRLGNKPRSLITELAALQEAPPAVREACEFGRLADSRSLYLLARAARDQPDRVTELLAGKGTINRSAIADALAPSPAAEAGAPAAAAAAESEERLEAGPAQGENRQDGKRGASESLGNALLVEYEGRKGRLTWTRQPGKHSGEVLFHDGTRESVNLQSLTLLAWTRR